MPKTVLVPIADGTEEMEAVTIIDILVRAGAEVTIASVETTLQITASRGVKLVADCMIAECSDKVYDLIALPGGLPGAEHLRDCDVLIQMLKSQKQSGRLYAAICASPAVALAPHGLLNGKIATCYPSCVDQLPDASKADLTVVVDENCITSQGPGTAMEFALELVAELFDPATARNVAEAALVRYND